MLHHAKSLLSSSKLFKEECDRLLVLFRRLKISWLLSLKSIVSKFMNENFTVHDPDPQAMFLNKPCTIEDRDAITIVLPFRHQKSAKVVKCQLFDLLNKVGKRLNPVFTRRKIKSELKVRERKLGLIVTSAKLVMLDIQLDT